MKTTSQNTQQNHWSGGGFRSAQSAQSAFDAHPPFTEEQVIWADAFSAAVGGDADRARIRSLVGNSDQITAWYWDDSYHCLRD